MEEEYYGGLTPEEVEQRVSQGLVNVTDNDIFKTKKEIIKTPVFQF